jgi:kynureninase
VTAPREAALRGGTVALDVPHAYEIAQLLLSKDVVVDYRAGAGIRIAPHFYTLDSELEHAVQVIDDGLASGEWKRFEGQRTTVT